MTDRTNHEWLADLLSTGQKRTQALEDLRKRLERGLFFYLTTSAVISATARRKTSNIWPRILPRMRCSRFSITSIRSGQRACSQRGN